VIVEPTADGRTRFATAMADLDPGEPVSEESVSSVLYAPAEAEPDLVVVLGPDDRLPPSLVWELAYAELVFVDTTWDELDVKHIHVAAAEFASRHRRFGGIES
jgi:undecaprenyl diphosphate synthase